MRQIIPIPTLNSADLERFISKLDGFPNLDTCWLWTASTDSSGYGKFSIKHTSYRASRVSASIWLAPPTSPNMIVLHSCDTPLCASPWHIRYGTQSQNIQDAIKRGRHRICPPPRQVLDVNQVLMIRASVDSSRKAAKKFGVSYMQILRIRNRQSWKQVL